MSSDEIKFHTNNNFSRNLGFFVRFNRAQVLLQLYISLRKLYQATFRLTELSGFKRVEFLHSETTLPTYFISFEVFFYVIISRFICFKHSMYLNIEKLKHNFHTRY